MADLTGIRHAVIKNLHREPSNSELGAAKIRRLHRVAQSNKPPIWGVGGLTVKCEKANISKPTQEVTQSFTDK